MTEFPRRLRVSALSLALLSGLGACASAPPIENVAGDYLGGRFAARFNQLDAAADAFARASDLAPADAKILRDAFFFRLAAGDIEAAVPYAEQMLRAKVDDASGLSNLTLAARAMKAGDFDRSDAALETRFDEPLVRSVAHMMRVWSMAGRSGPRAALEKLASGEDDLFKGFNPTHQAILFEMAGDLGASRASHEASARGFGGPVGREAFGAFLERHGEPDVARNYYTALAETPGPQRRAAEAGLARIEAGRPSTDYKSLKPNEGVAIALYSFAGAIVEQASLQRERAVAAGFNVSDPQYNLPLTLLQLAIYLDPKRDEARRLAGSVLNVYEDYESAAEVLSGIDPSSPYFEQAQIDIATGLYQAERKEEAIAALRRAVREMPRTVEARLTLANIYAAEDDHEKAVDTASAAIDRLPAEENREDSWRYYIVRAASLLELDRWPEAEQDLIRARDIAPEEATTLNFLGYSWAERGVNLEEAFDLIEKALALEPTSGAITDSLGWAHYQLGRYDLAAEHLERAASLEPADATITDHLGDAYWRLDRPREARYQWHHALELDPGEKLRAVIEAKLRDGLEVTADAGNSDGDGDDSGLRAP